jgi:putative NADH-flavin reductase
VKLVIFGPTGGTGRELMSQALAAGHGVTALTMNPQAIEPPCRTVRRAVDGSSMRAD